MAAGSQHRCVFVGNIPYDATEEQLIQICEEVGPVVSFRLVLDRETGKPKGYGFCEYKDEETALSARRNLQGYEINGRQLRVDFAENDKNSDRNREQGRGGPGLTSNIDVQKPQGSTSVLGDSALHQPIGLPLAATAASVMAGALGGAQIASLLSNQNGIQNQSVSGLGNDPLTQYLAKMSRHQLNEILSGMKVLATQNKALARQLLEGSPQLPKALFQAQIMLGMVSPQMLQVANTQQTSGSLQKPSFQDSMPDHKPILPPHPSQPPLQKVAPVGVITRPSHIPLANISQNLSVPLQSALPHVPIQLQVQQQLPSQDQLPLAGTLAGLSGVPKVPAMRSQPLGGSFQLQNSALPSSQGLIPQIQPPLLQHSTPVGNATHPHMASSDTVLQKTIPPRPLTSQPSSSNYPLMPCGLETFPREAGPSASPGLDSTWASGINLHPSLGTSLAEHTSIVGSTLERIDRPSKLAKLHDGSAAPQLLSGNTSTFKPLSSQSDCPASLSRSDKPTPQFPPEVESALLQQVMSLTPEQVSSLPKEQQEQVLQIQKALQQQVMNFQS